MQRGSRSPKRTRVPLSVSELYQSPSLSLHAGILEKSPFACLLGEFKVVILTEDNSQKSSAHNKLVKSVLFL